MQISVEFGVELYNATMAMLYSLNSLEKNSIYVAVLLPWLRHLIGLVHVLQANTHTQQRVAATGQNDFKTVKSM